MSKKKASKSVKHKKSSSKKTAKKKVKKTFAEYMSKNLLKVDTTLIIIVVVILAVIVSIITQIGAPEEEFELDEKGDKVTVDFYVMSQCPYGTQVEDAIKPVMDKIGDNVELNINYIADDLGGGNFRSLHGEKEVKGNIVQLCVNKYYPEDSLNFIICQNKDAQNVHTNWETCASENNLDVEKIRTCFEGDEGKQLLSASVKKAQEAGARASPTIYINGQQYQGARDSLSFMIALCSGLEGVEECDDVKVVEFEVIVLNDKTCRSCDTSQITRTTQQLFPGADHRNVDVSSDEGKRLIEELGITVVPAYIFGSNLTETNTWTSNTGIRGAFEKKGDYYKLRDAATGAKHYIDEEMRAQYFELIGVTLGDNRPQIDFFVMSYCPSGNQAEEAIEGAFQALKGKADFNPHYVIYSNYGGGGPNFCIDEESKYCSLHGIVELNQDIREMCVNNYFGTEEWFEFVIAMNSQCNSQNADTCWEAVADEQGLDKEKINTCFETEALDIVKEEKELGDMLGVSASPTVFVDGEAYSSSRPRTAAGFQAALCAAFDEAPEECEGIQQQASQQTEAPVAGGCG